VPIAALWLDGELAELERLVREGDTLQVVSRLSTIVRAPQRITVGARVSTRE
jgi:hypothetical protein